MMNDHNIKPIKNFVRDDDAPISLDLNKYPHLLIAYDDMTTRNEMLKNILTKINITNPTSGLRMLDADSLNKYPLSKYMSPDLNYLTSANATQNGRVSSNWSTFQTTCTLRRTGVLSKQNPLFFVINDGDLDNKESLLADIIFKGLDVSPEGISATELVHQGRAISCSTTGDGTDTQVNNFLKTLRTCADVNCHIIAATSLDTLDLICHCYPFDALDMFFPAYLQSNCYKDTSLTLTSEGNTVSTIYCDKYPDEAFSEQQFHSELHSLSSRETNVFNQSGDDYIVN